MGDIRCPGERLYSLLDGLTPRIFQKLRDSYEIPFSTELLNLRLEMGFSNLTERQRKVLLKQAQSDHLERRQTYILLQSYGDDLLGISDTLRGHVEGCTGDGGCLSKYYLYLEDRTRELMGLEAIGEIARSDTVELENSLPEEIRRLDFAKLDLGVF